MPTYDLGLEHVSLAFATKNIFTDVTQGVFEGDRIGIVGKNGDGKSTLLHLFKGTQEPDSGRVTMRNGLTFGMLDQRDPLDDNATVREAALEGREDYEWAAETKSREIVEALLGGISLDAKIGSLSGGQRRRADLARLLLKDWDILALDEPTNHLDMRTKDVLKQAIRDFNGTVIVVSHDREFLDGLVSKVYEFGGGRVREHLGGIYDFLESRKLESLRELEQRNPATAVTDKKVASPKAESAPAISAAPEGSKLSYEEQKELARRLRKAEKEVADTEKRVADLEAQIASLEEKLSTPEGAADTSLYEQHGQLKKQLDDAMWQWSEASETLEHLQKQGK